MENRNQAMLLLYKAKGFLEVLDNHLNRVEQPVAVEYSGLVCDSISKAIGMLEEEKEEAKKVVQKYKCRMCKRIDEFEPSPTAEEQETVYIIACRHCATQNRVEVNNDI